MPTTRSIGAGQFDDLSATAFDANGRDDIALALQGDGGLAAGFGRLGRLSAVGQGREDPVEVVASDRSGNVRGSASFAVGTLEAPFVPSRRAVMGRFALDPALDPRTLISPLVAFGRRLAAERSVPFIELTDLPPPGTPPYQATLEASAVPWSRIYCKLASH